MDPLTAFANAMTAYITYATAVFNAMPPDRQQAIATVQSEILQNMLEVALRGQERLERIGQGIDRAFTRRKGKDAGPDVPETDAKGNV